MAQICLERILDEYGKASASVFVDIGDSLDDVWEEIAALKDRFEFFGLKEDLELRRSMARIESRLRKIEKLVLVAP
jgi:hypothetical protein